MTQRNDAFELTYKPQLPPRHDYGIGIIGCGGIMNYAHLPAYKAHQLNIIGCYDVNPTAMHETAQHHGIGTTYPDIAALLADPRIEIVDIAVPAWEQRAIAAQVLAAGGALFRCGVIDLPLH
jgi:predicted dehydrogenase